MKLLGRLVLLVFVVLLASCHCGGKKKAVKSTLQNKTEMALLMKAVRSQLDAVSDSGTLRGNLLNFADSVALVLGEKRNTERWFLHLLANKEHNLREIINCANLARDHGLQEEFYHKSILTRLYRRISGYGWDSIIPYDSLALTLIYSADASLGFYHDMRRGRAEPSYTGSIDVLPRRQAGSLTALLVSDTLVAALNHSIPRFQPYVALQKEYIRLYNLPKKALGNQLTFTKKLRLGDSLPRYQMKALARKLRLHGYLELSDSALDKIVFYNDDVFRAVYRFQGTHNLETNGVLDKKTRDKLNVTRDEMLLKLRANLERWRWLGPVPEHSRVWVNIAENRLYAFKQDTLKLEMNVCAGKNRDEAYYEKLEKSKEDPDVLPPDNLETPLMKATLTHLVVNPSWFVPRNIMIKELLPQIKQNPGILAEKNYVLKNHKGEEIDPFSVDWSMVTSKNWKYRVEQLPGDENALGKVVVHFPNSYSIFLHDTPAKSAFGWLDRHVSHGCVRMEQPLEMIQFITSFHKKDNIDEVYIAAGLEPIKDEKKIKKYQEDMKDSAKAEKLKPKPNRYYKAESPIPVYLVYFTCFQTQAGGLDYVSDGYQRDQKLLDTMKKPRKKSAKAVTKAVKKDAPFSP